jgi:hypothetical protein
MNLYEQLQDLAPFGPRNMRPVFVMRNMQVDERTRIIGNDRSHVKFHFANLPDDVEGVAFGLAHKWEQLQQHSLVGGIDICFSLATNTFNGKTTLQLEIKDISLPQSFEEIFVFKPVVKKKNAGISMRQSTVLRNKHTFRMCKRNARKLRTLHTR